MYHVYIMAPEPFKLHNCLPPKEGLLCSSGVSTDVSLEFHETEH